MERKIGLSRNVLLTKNYAIKFPRLCTWRNFINGLQSNLQERELSKKKYPELCPVLFSDWAGLIVVMPRGDPNDRPLAKGLYMRLVWHEDSDKGYSIPAENKPGSFALFVTNKPKEQVLVPRILAIDYGCVMFSVGTWHNKYDKEWFEVQANRGLNQ